MKTYKKQQVESNVFDSALERFRLLYDRYDKVVVSFSGGKDSTVCLNLALMVAREKNRLPVDVMFFDEEAIHPPTIEYVERVRQNPDVRMKWLCVPIKHRNACSRKEPWWYCWDEDKRGVWCRPLPEGAITTLPGFKKGMSMPECAHFAYGPEHGMVAMVRGLRADESLRRYRSVAMKLEDNWIMRAIDGYSVPCSPIYDWTTRDVWIAPQKFGWDYNTTYDIFDKAGVALHLQRVCPPYGEEPLRGLHLYAECFPELWDAMIMRVHGAATAARYANTELYTFDGLELPKGIHTWREYFDLMVELNAPNEQTEIVKTVNQLIKQHNRKSKNVIEDETPDPITGASWKFFCFLCIRGDFKGRRAGNMTTESDKTRRKRGITFEEALRDEANTRFQ